MKRVNYNQIKAMPSLIGLVLILISSACDPYAAGNKMLQEGKYKDAATYFEDKIKSKPNDPVLNNQLAYSYTKIGKFNDALKYYQKAVQLKPDYPEAHYNLGYLYMNRPFMRIPDAIKEFNQAITLKPSYARAFNNRGLSYCYSARYDQGQKDLQKAVELDAQNTVYKDNLNYCKNLAEATRAVPSQPNKPAPPAAPAPGNKP